MSARSDREQAQSLREVSRELQRVNRALRRLARRGGARRALRPPEISGASVRAILAVRRLRDECFGPSVGELPWAVLLEAYAARLEGRLSPMTSLGASAGVARSTAHRWVAWLLQQGLLVRHPEPPNRRTALVGPSDAAAARIADYLTAAARMSPLLG